jgi:hypothetical protein
MGADDGTGTFILDRVEVGRVVANQIPGEPLAHAVYVATDRDSFPDSVFRVQDSYIHSYRGIGIKSRAARTELYFNWIDAPNTPETLYTLELIGFAAFETDKPQHSDVVGNVLIHRSPFGMRFGGDGTGTSKGRVRFAHNSVVLSSLFTATTSAIRVFQTLDAVYLVNNVFARDQDLNQPIRIFGDLISTEGGTWVSGRPKLAGRNNHYPIASATAPAASAEWLGSTFGSSQVTAINLVGSINLSPGNASPLIGKATAIESSPTGYEIPNPLVDLNYRASETPPISGQILSARQRTSPVRNIGSQ